MREDADDGTFVQCPGVGQVAQVAVRPVDYDLPFEISLDLDNLTSPRRD